MTLASTVREAARRFGDTPAFVAADEAWSISYAELDRVSELVAFALTTDHPVGEGSVVGLTLPSTIDYVVAYAALAKLGAVTAGINPRYTAPERRAVLDVLRPDLVITTPDLAAGCPAGVAQRTIEAAGSVGELFADLLPDGLTDAAGPVLDDDPDRLVAIVFTSGTTGTPKGAMFGNRELAAITAADVGDRWGGGGAMLASTQFAHIGSMTKLPWYLRLGTTTYLIDRWRAPEVLRLIQDHRMSSIGGIAPQVALMLRDPGFDSFDLTSVTTIVMGGAMSPPALVREARERFGAAYSIRYSSTESGGIGTGTAFDADDDEALFTVGRPRGDVRIEIRTPEGAPAAAGEVGQIWLRSSCMMRGYWRDPAATSECMHEGWLHTGDLGSLDGRGLLHLAGRTKEMYIRGGYNVYPAEVEAVLAAHPAVRDVAIVPRSDEVMGEIGVACVVPIDPARPPTLEDLRAHGREHLASYKLPEAVHVLEDMPLTPNHKVDRRAVRARIEGGVGHT